MEKTMVRAYFAIYGNHFDVNEISNKMEILPTQTTTKDIIPKGKKKPSIETSWEVSTLKEESYDINEQLIQLINILKSKKQILLEIKNKYNIKFIFTFVIEIENNEKPAIYFEEETIKFISDINAKIGVDYYIYS